MGVQYTCSYPSCTNCGTNNQIIPMCPRIHSHDFSTQSLMNCDQCDHAFTANACGRSFWWTNLDSTQIHTCLFRDLRFHWRHVMSVKLLRAKGQNGPPQWLIMSKQKAVQTDTVYPMSPPHNVGLGDKVWQTWPITPVEKAEHAPWKPQNIDIHRSCRPQRPPASRAPADFSQKGFTQQTKKRQSELHN